MTSMSAERSTGDRGASDRIAELPYRSLVERVPAIVYVDPVGPDPTSPTYVSPFIEQLLGYAPEVATGDPEWWAQALHPDDRERVQAEWRTSDASGEPYAGEYRLMAADGRTVWIRDEAILLRDQEGNPVHWQGVMVDITAAKQANDDLTRALTLERQATEEMRRADEIKTTFLTAVSHDIRTPLSAILGNALTLEEGDRLGITEEERKQLIHSLAAKARRLNAIVTDLLDTERLARGVVEPKLQEIAVGRLISLLVWDSEAMAGRQVHVDAGSVTAWIDPQIDLSDRREPADERRPTHAGGMPGMGQGRAGGRGRADRGRGRRTGDPRGTPRVGVPTFRARSDDLGAQPGGRRRALAGREVHRASSWARVDRTAGRWWRLVQGAHPERRSRGGAPERRRPMTPQIPRDISRRGPRAPGENIHVETRTGRCFHRTPLRRT